MVTQTWVQAHEVQQRGTALVRGAVIRSTPCSSQPLDPAPVLAILPLALAVRLLRLLERRASGHVLCLQVELSLSVAKHAVSSAG